MEAPGANVNVKLALYLRSSTYVVIVAKWCSNVIQVEFGITSLHVCTLVNVRLHGNNVNT